MKGYFWRSILGNMRKVRVLFVCLGNICRSPLAEAIFKNKTKIYGLDHIFEADSCGTGNYHIGSQPDPRTISNARKNNLPIDHCARQLNERDLEEFDYILAMDASNLKNILKLPNAALHTEKISLLRDVDPLNKGAEVPDPYFGNEDGFQEVYELLDWTMDKFIEQLKQDHRIENNEGEGLKSEG
jgi:protein-tyrosine phosphatase